MTSLGPQRPTAKPARARHADARSACRRAQHAARAHRDLGETRRLIAAVAAFRTTAANPTLEISTIGGCA